MFSSVTLEEIEISCAEMNKLISFVGVSYHGHGHMIYVIQLLLEVNHVVPLTCYLSGSASLQPSGILHGGQLPI